MKRGIMCATDGTHRKWPVLRAAATRPCVDFTHLARTSRTRPRARNLSLRASLGVPPTVDDLGSLNYPPRLKHAGTTHRTRQASFFDLGLNQCPDIYSRTTTILPFSINGVDGSDICLARYAHGKVRRLAQLRRASRKIHPTLFV